MRRFIITGAPGAGKTAIIRQLELDGFSVVEEAATDILAASRAKGTIEPWKHPSFIDVIAHLQRERQFRASHQSNEIQFHDRCVVCAARVGSLSRIPFFTFSHQRAGPYPKRSHLPKTRFLHSQSWLHHADRSAANHP